MEYGLFDKALKIEIPEIFNLLSQEELASIYRVENRPQIVFTTEDRKCQMAISRMKLELTKDMLAQVTNMVKANIQRANPAFIFFEEKVIVGRYIDYGWFDYMGYGPGGVKVYYINAVVIVKGHMNMISFFCSYEKKDEYKPIFLEIYRGMKDTSRL